MHKRFNLMVWKFDEDEWEVDFVFDLGEGGIRAKGKSLKEAIRNFGFKLTHIKKAELEKILKGLE